MNQQKLTPRYFETNRRHSTLQILLLLVFTSLFAAPALGQVNNRQSESFLLSDDSGAIVQCKKLPAIDFGRPRSDEQTEEQFAVARRVSFKLDNSVTDRAASNAEDRYAALAKIFSPAPSKTSLFTRTTALEPATSSSKPQADPDLSKFAVFIDAGVAVPHGDLSFFLDPGISLNPGLEYMITEQFSAEGIFGYHRFSSFFGGNANLYQLSGNAKVYLVDESNKFRPFVNGGVGAYVTDSATTHFGGNVGAGVLYEVTPRFGIRGAYNFHIFSAGSAVKYSTAQGGVRFRF